jgi:hypothetical protein
MLSVPVAHNPHGFGELDFRTSSISHARISTLSIEHDDLDSAIDALVKTSMHDDLIVARLKKRRLQIRDEIASLAAAAQMREAPDLLPSGATIAAPEPDLMSEVEAAPKSGGGSVALGVFASLLILLVLVLGWSDVVDSVNQTVAQIYLLSLVAAAHG